MTETRGRLTAQEDPSTRTRWKRQSAPATAPGSMIAHPNAAEPLAPMIAGSPLHDWRVFDREPVAGSANPVEVDGQQAEFGLGSDLDRS